MTQKEYIRMEMKKRLKKLRAQIKGGEEVGSACYYTSAYCRRRIDSAISLIPEMMKRYPSLSEDILLDVFNQACKKDVLVSKLLEQENSSMAYEYPKGAAELGSSLFFQLNC